MNRSELLESLYPGNVIGILSSDPGTAMPLHAEELAYTTGMVDKRLSQFRHGRSCARHGLECLGQAPEAISVGRSREPIWPAGTIGSISHTNRVAGATLALQCHYRSIGVDIECNSPLESDLVHRICVAKEIAAMPTGFDTGSWGKLLFSIKEAVYKCIWPDVRRIIEFNEVIVNLDRAGSSYTVHSTDPAVPIANLESVRGKFSIHQKYIYSSAYLSSEVRDGTEK